MLKTFYTKNREVHVPAACTEREPSFNKDDAALLLMLLMEEATSSGMCSTPTVRPCGPTIIAKQAVKYPVPVSKSQAGVNLNPQWQ